MSDQTQSPVGVVSSDELEHILLNAKSVAGEHGYSAEAMRAAYEQGKKHMREACAFVAERTIHSYAGGYKREPEFAQALIRLAGFVKDEIRTCSNE